MNVNTKVAIGIGFVAVLFALINGQVKKTRTEQLLKDSNYLTFGQVISFGYSQGGASAPARYSFSVNNKKFENSFSRNTFCKKLSQKDKDYIKNIKLPILYHPPKPEVSILLVKRSDYKKYGIDYPDSLANVLQTYFECD
ncbi:MAG: hypothetical protein AAF573_17065 [Bacteroidota bacterium]